MTRSFARNFHAAWILAATVGVALALSHLTSASAKPGASAGTTSGVVDEGGGGRAKSTPPKEPTDLPRLEAKDTAGPEPAPVSDSEAPKAIARFEGSPLPGLSVTLTAVESRGKELRVRWVQVEGPPVRLDDPTAVSARFTVPDEGGSLGFLLVVADGRGIDSTGLNIPLKGQDPHEGKQKPPLLADAGDDQIGLIGHQITLNGIRSEPVGAIGYRWLQVGGPTVRLKIERGEIFSFVPTLPGIYRFALVVASGGEISEPDEVSVRVGSGTRQQSPGDPARGTPPDPEAVTIREVARAGLAALKGGEETAVPLGQAFDDTADRMDLYESYADAFSEMSRRIEPILPEAPPQRNLWVAHLFQPLTARLIEVMRSEGLDLRTQEGQSAPLTISQRATLAEQFRLMAEGVRSTTRPVEPAAE